MIAYLQAKKNKPLGKKSVQSPFRCVVDLTSLVSPFDWFLILFGFWYFPLYFRRVLRDSHHIIQYFVMTDTISCYSVTNHIIEHKKTVEAGCTPQQMLYMAGRRQYIMVEHYGVVDHVCMQMHKLIFQFWNIANMLYARFSMRPFQSKFQYGWKPSILSSLTKTIKQVK